MELTAAIAVIVAAIAPFITALFTRPGLADNTKRLIAAGVAVVLGAVVAVATGQIEGAPPELTGWLVRVLVAIAIVVSLAQGFYNQFKGPVRKLESATSPATDEDPHKLVHFTVNSRDAYVDQATVTANGGTEATLAKLNRGEDLVDPNEPEGDAL